MYYVLLDSGGIPFWPEIHKNWLYIGTSYVSKFFDQTSMLKLLARFSERKTRKYCSPPLLFLKNFSLSFYRYCLIIWFFKYNIFTPVVNLYEILELPFNIFKIHLIKLSDENFLSLEYLEFYRFLKISESIDSFTTLYWTVQSLS